MPEQADPYRMSLDRSMLDHLRGNVEDDPEEAKQELRKSVERIQDVYRKHTINREIRDIGKLLASDPHKVSYQKRVLKLLRRDFEARQSWLGWFEQMRDLVFMQRG
jgi:uncharacterized protein (UPF0335 family)